MRGREQLKTRTAVAHIEKPFAERLRRDWKRNYSLYILVLPVVLFYLIFCYKPMYGILMAFQDFNFRAGISGSPWVGLKQFERFFADPYFVRNIRNTITISLASIAFGFPAPIILALLINELNKKWFVKTVQTITYLPHFISLVVICGMLKDFLAGDGFITQIFATLTGQEITESLLNNQNLFVPIYVISDIWQQVGWSSIIYIAALTGINAELYEAASIDGAGRFKQLLHVTLPAIIPTIVIMLILRLGSVLSVGYEKIMLLTNPFNAETSEVLSYYVYKKGIVGGEYSLATAAGLFNSVINFVFVVLMNNLSRRIGETSLW